MDEVKPKAGQLNEAQLNALKSSGRLRLGPDQKPVDAVKSVDVEGAEYLFNMSIGVVGIPDLGIDLYGHELVHLPSLIKDFKPDTLRTSQDLRNAVHVMKVVRVVKDPKEITISDLAAPVAPFDTLSKEVEHRADVVLGGTNVYQEKLKEEVVKEEKMNQALVKGPGREEIPGMKRGVRG